jgi:monoterpene epsilon-lactone hydrolase
MNGSLLRKWPGLAALCLIGVAGSIMRYSSSAQSSSPGGAQLSIDGSGTLHVRDMEVPFSDLASAESKKMFIKIIREREEREAELKGITDIKELRRRLDETYIIPNLREMQAQFATNTQAQMIGGVQTDIVTPAQGVSPKNTHRVLINLHGGGFAVAARYGGQAEAIPLASLERIKVVTVDYREGPENRFPAASQDVEKVYRELLKSYPARNIGIYGCSAGAILTAQSVAWFRAHHLPRPGAIGMFGGGAVVDRWGDSNYFGSALGGYPSPGSPPNKNTIEYLEGADLHDSLVSPVYYDDVLAWFPPSLIVSGTRDAQLSPSVFTHERLVDVGAQSDLHVWEGAIHCSISWDQPETRQAYRVIVKFFDQHLGTATNSH